MPYQSMHIPRLANHHKSDLKLDLKLEWRVKKDSKKGDLKLEWREKKDSKKWDLKLE